MEFDTHLPNLELGGWRPGVYWVPTAEQVSELEIRAEAEAITDRTYRIQKIIGSKALNDDLPLSYPPQDSEEREQHTQESIIFAKQEYAYNHRSLDQISTDILQWIIQLDSNPSTRHIAHHAMEREATALLRRKATHPEEATLDPAMDDTLVRWAAIEHFMYHWPRMWCDNISYDETFELLRDTGISEEELYELLDTPLNPKAKKNAGGYNVPRGNQVFMEKRLLDLMTANGVDLSPDRVSAVARCLLSV